MHKCLGKDNLGVLCFGTYIKSEPKGMYEM